jgi:tripartite-type tricarboxylate transporter receptor subunit TctC
LPDVPTVAESMPGFEAVTWYAIVAPPRTPEGILAKINADVNEALRQPEVQAQLTKLSAEIFGGSLDRTSDYMHREAERWRNVITSANIQMQ